MWIPSARISSWRVGRRASEPASGGGQVRRGTGAGHQATGVRLATWLDYHNQGEVTTAVEQARPERAPAARFTDLHISAIDKEHHRITEPKEHCGAEAPSRAHRGSSPGVVHLWSSVVGPPSPPCSRAPLHPCSSAPPPPCVLAALAPLRYFCCAWSPDPARVGPLAIEFGRRAVSSIVYRPSSIVHRPPSIIPRPPAICHITATRV